MELDLGRRRRKRNAISTPMNIPPTQQPTAMPATAPGPSPLLDTEEFGSVVGEVRAGVVDEKAEPEGLWSRLDEDEGSEAGLLVEPELESEELEEEAFPVGSGEVVRELVWTDVEVNSDDDDDDDDVVIMVGTAFVVLSVEGLVEVVSA